MVQDNFPIQGTRVLRLKRLNTLHNGLKHIIMKFHNTERKEKSLPSGEDAVPSERLKIRMGLIQQLHWKPEGKGSRTFNILRGSPNPEVILSQTPSTVQENKNIPTQKLTT